MIIQVKGNLKRNERANILAAYERMGFEISQDSNGRVTVARPDVISKPEFVEIVTASATDTVMYAGVSWGMLINLARSKRGGKYPDLPLTTLHGSWSGKSAYSHNLLVAETILPTAEWLEEYGEKVVDSVVNKRFIDVVRNVGEKCIKIS